MIQSVHYEPANHLIAQLRRDSVVIKACADVEHMKSRSNEYSKRVLAEVASGANSRARARYLMHGRYERE